MNKRGNNMKKSDKLDKRQKNYLKKKFNIDAYKDLTPEILKRLKKEMMKLEDKRIKKKCTYKLWDIVVCVVISVLCGKKDWEEIYDFVYEKQDFFKKFLKMTGGVPSSKTYERVMSMINYKELEQILLSFFKSITKNIYEDIDILNIDGRVNNGSKRKKTYKVEQVSPLNMLNVYSNNHNLCLWSEMIDTKTNEIPMTEYVLKQLNVAGTVVTWDALNTQKMNVKIAREQGADYVVPIKGNHEVFYKELVDYFDEKKLELIIAGQNNTALLVKNEYKNGTAITYEYFQDLNVDWYENKDEWKDLNSIGIVKKTIRKLVYNPDTKKDEEVVKTEIRYYISSLGLNIKLFSKAIRNHWSVENKLHWHMDFTFRLDKNRTLNKNALASLEIINKFCLGILKRVQKYYGISLKRIIGKLSLNVDDNFLELLALLAIADGKEKGEI